MLAHQYRETMIDRQKHKGEKEVSESIRQQYLFIYFPDLMSTAPVASLGISSCGIGQAHPRYDGVENEKRGRNRQPEPEEQIEQDRINTVGTNPGKHQIPN
jgi:hypothetical protein